MAGVLYDLQATQSVDHRDRGVARYVAEVAAAVERRRPGMVRRFTLNPDLPPPGPLDGLVATGRVSPAPAPDDGDTLLHVASPLELAVPLERVWPAALRRSGLPLVVTLYDLIPLVYPGQYLADPGLRSRYLARLELVKAAERVLAISECTRREAIERLGLDPARVVQVGAGTGAEFVPPADRAGAAAAARAAVAGLHGPYVLYTGGIEHRKNLDRLVAAWARVPPAARAGRVLVVVCRAGAADRHHYDVLAGTLGVGGQVLLTGYVADDDLVRLYQGAELFVFPSLYEGYGLPVAEAQACGAPVVAARTSSLTELVDPAATFDPLDPDDMAAVVGRALTDEAFRAGLLHRSAPAARPPSWDDVAGRTLAAYDEVLADHRRRPPRPPRPRPRVAVVTPLPPERSGVATFAAHLLPELGRHADVDAFVQAPPEQARAPEGVAVHRVDRLALVEAARGGYDRVLYQLGNSEFHGGALAALRHRPGVVLAHEARLVDLYALAAWNPAAAPGGFAATVRRLYPTTALDLDGVHRLDPGTAARAGLVMAREVVALAERFLTTSPFAAGLARTDAGPALHHRIAAVPFAMSPPAGAAAPDPAGRDDDLLVSAGVVHEVKQPDTLLAALAVLRRTRPGARLALVGPTSEALAARLGRLAAELGVAEAFEITGWVDDAAYAGWLARATLAVQLRAHTNGESSAALGECLSMGVPAVVSALGAATDLPDDAVVKVPAHVAPADLAALLDGLLADPGRRRRLGQAGRAHAEAHSFARLADVLAAELLDPR